ncbi:FAD-binding protein [Microbacterium stercoris]|uniref:FAD-binding protein n=1 Tax=Microbacterium stercoris TaxID=2820289 RepID=A0A939QJ64_9MICO|nr:FAD-binding protein [Microbacterium stercoris]MBO3663095.1 FAD-binding protein [Microbacterium stercoris]
MTLTNWAGNVRFRATEVATPSTIDEVREILSRPGKVRALGSGHSFNLIADTDATLISTAKLTSAPVIDEEARTVTVGAGTRYGELAPLLEQRGWALANLASLPHITIAGSVATGTHGSGDGVGTLSSAVAGIELVTASGEVRNLRRGDREFNGAVVSLGALGIVTRITLDIEPSFEVTQRVFTKLPLETALENFDAIMSAAYSVSMFLQWTDPDVVDQVWTKARDEQVPVLPGDPAAASERMHPLAGVSAEACTEQLGLPGRWMDRLPHFRLDFTPSNGDELQSELLVPRRNAVEAIRTLRTLADDIAPLIQVTEVRSMKADKLWLSPAYQTDAIGLHFTWKQDQPAVEAVIAKIEGALAPFDPRPHWGKLSLAPVRDLARVWPKLGDFAALAREFDPEGRFRNDHLAFLDDLGR